jgi:hypothetical protein
MSEIFYIDNKSYYIHSRDICKNWNCVFHNPSDHLMKDWKINIRLDNRSLVERLCPKHGVGHPDPDSLAYFEKINIRYMGVHGCCGCCRLDKSSNSKLMQWLKSFK